MQQRRRIENELIAQKRLVVGEGDANIAVRPPAEVAGERRQLFGRDILRLAALVRHGNRMVLAEGTGEVAAEAADGEDEASGVEVTERLLLDGIERDGGEPAIVPAADLAALVRPCAAKPAPASREPAMMRTEGADDACVCSLCPCRTIRRAQWWRSTSKRQMRTSSSSAMPPFLRAILSCSSTVSTPSRSGRSSPFLPRASTITP